jgi:hypothetical protein
MNKKILGLVILLGIAIISQTGITQNNNPDSNFPGSSQNFMTIVSKFFQLLAVLIAIVAVIFIMLGAFQFLTAGGDPDKAAQGKRQVIYAVIGLFVAFSAWALVTWFVNQFQLGQTK